MSSQGGGGADPRPGPVRRPRNRSRPGKRSGNRSRTLIDISAIKSVARPDQLQDDAQPQASLVLGQQLLQDAGGLFEDLDENDPILRATATAATSSSGSGSGTPTTSAAASAPAKSVSVPPLFSPLNASANQKENENENDKTSQQQQQQQQQQEENTQQDHCDANNNHHNNHHNVTNDYACKANHDSICTLQQSNHPKKNKKKKNLPETEPTESVNKSDNENKDKNTNSYPTNNDQKNNNDEDQDLSISSTSTESSNPFTNQHLAGERIIGTLSTSSSSSSLSESQSSYQHYNTKEEQDKTTAFLNQLDIANKEKDDDYDNEDDEDDITDTPGLHPEEVQVLRCLRKQIDAQEEQHYLHQVKKSIHRQQENELLDDISRDIANTEEQQQQQRQQPDHDLGVQADQQHVQEEVDNAADHDTSDDGEEKKADDVSFLNQNDNTTATATATATVPTIANRASMVAEPEQLQQQQQQHHQEQLNDDIAQARATKRIPKQLGNKELSEEEPYICIDTFQEKVVQKFRDTLSPYQSTMPFHAHLTEIPNGHKRNNNNNNSNNYSDEESYLLTAQGHKTILEGFRIFFRDWFQVEWVRQCHQDLIEDNNTIEMEVLLDKKDLLNVWAEEFLIEVSARGQSLGLWVDFSTMAPAVQTLFQDLLGRKALDSDTLAVAIRRIDATLCTTKQAWVDLGNQLQDTADVDVLATICVSGYADLTSLDKSRVVGEVRPAGTPTVPRVVTVDTTSEMVNSDIEPSLASRSWSARGEKDQSSFEKKGLAHQPSEAQASKAYGEFKVKYRDVYDIEYQRSEIGYQLATSSMWTKHKFRFGSQSCDDNCPCALELDYLTESVVEKWRTVQMRKADKGWDIPDFAKDISDSPVGFVNRFVPKFVPLLQEKYPNDNPRELLQRLVKMWNKGHLFQQNFGSRCEKGCTCLDGWTRVFKEGDLDALAAGTQKKNSAGRSKEMIPSIPRKRSYSEATNNAVAMPSGGASDSAPSSGQPIAVSEPPQLPLQRAESSMQPSSRRDVGYSSKAGPSVAGKPTTTCAHLERYCVTYNTRSPLGFYCVTDRLAEERVCKVTSVCPTGESRKKSCLIKAGTRVDAVGILQGSKMVDYPIQGHEELLQYYNLAKEKGEDLKLWFVNSGVMESSEIVPIASAPIANEDWSSNGKWRGRSTSGWAGGADVVAHFMATSNQHRSAPSLTGYTASVAATDQTLTQNWPRPPATRQSIPHPSARPSNPPERSPAQLADQLETLKETRSPLHRYEKPDFSILRTSAARQQHGANEARRVRFRNGGSECYYEKTSPSCRLLKSSGALRSSSVAQSSSGASSADTAIISPNAAIEAVRKNDSKGLTHSLHGGHVKADQLAAEYRFTKERGFESVHRVLAIYKAASIAISAAQSLKSWTAFEIRVQNIHGLRLSREGMADPELNTFKGSVKHYVNNQGKKLLSLPPMDIAENIDYSAGGVAALPQYGPLHFNSGLLEEGRKFVIHLYKANGDMKVLAKLEIPMSEIHANCYTVGREVLMERKFECEQFIEDGASVCLQATKVVVLPEYCEKKRQAGANELQNVIDWMERFNSDSDLELKAKIIGNQNFTLLHAAIVFRRADLVSRLLALGADSNFKSDQGSAVAFVTSLADRARERLQYDIDKKNMDESKQKRLENGVKCLDDIAKELLQCSKRQRQNDSFVCRELGGNQPLPSDSPPGYTRYSHLSGPQRNGHSGPVDSEEKTSAASFAGGSAFESRTSFSLANRHSSSSYSFSTGMNCKQASVPSMETHMHSDTQVAPCESAKIVPNRTYKPSPARDGSVHQSMSTLQMESRSNPVAKPTAAAPSSSYSPQEGTPLEQQNTFSSPSDNEVLALFCESVGRYGESWIAASKVAVDFYHRIGRKDHNEYIKIRSQAVSESLIESGRPERFGRNQAIIKCDIHDTNSNLAPGWYFRLSRKGATLLKDLHLLDFCKVLELHRSNEQGWTAEGLVGSAFYKQLGNTDRHEFAAVRRRSMEEGLVEYGRKNTKARGEPVVVCDQGQTQNLSTAAFLRLTPHGQAFAQCRRGSFLEQPKSLPAKRKAPSTGNDNEPPTKKRGNPIEIPGLKDANLVPLPSSDSCKPATADPKNSSKSTESVELNVLGGVGKFTVTASKDSEEGELFDIKKLSDDALLLLESIRSQGDTWVPNGDAANQFYRYLGSAIDKARFKAARADATREGLVEWGRRDLDLPEAPIVPQVDRSAKGRMSLDSFLRLTSAGHKAYNAAHLHVPSTVTKRPAQKPPYLSAAASSNILHGQTTHSDRKDDTEMTAFLQCLLPCQDDGSEWFKMADVAESFYSKHGDMDEAVVINLRQIATRDGLIDWGRSDPMRFGHVNVASANQFDSSSPEAFLRLTPKGHQYYAKTHGESEERDSSGPYYPHSYHDDHRDNHAHRRYSHGAPQSGMRAPHYERKSADATLPTVVNGDTWFVEGSTRQRCKFFRNAREPKCMHGKHCRFAHVQPPLRDLLNKKDLRPPNLDREVVYCERPDAHGRSWITAAFQDRATGIFYKAEGGPSGRVNHQDIWWYPTRGEARRAVEIVCAASTYDSSHSRLHLQHDSRQGGPSLRGHYCR